MHEGAILVLTEPRRGDLVAPAIIGETAVEKGGNLGIEREMAGLGGRLGGAQARRDGSPVSTNEPPGPRVPVPTRFPRGCHGVRVRGVVGSWGLMHGDLAPSLTEDAVGVSWGWASLPPPSGLADQLRHPLQPLTDLRIG